MTASEDLGEDLGLDKYICCLSRSTLRTSIQTGGIVGQKEEGGGRDAGCSNDMNGGAIRSLRLARAASRLTNVLNERAKTWIKQANKATTGRSSTGVSSRKI